MLKNITKIPFAHRQALRVFQRSYPFFRFSNTNASNIPHDEKPAEDKAQDTKTSTKVQYYYPVKRINFSKRDYFPIYTTDSKSSEHKIAAPQFFSAYSLFLGYGISYIFFLDIYNYWHFLPLMALFYHGSKSFFKTIKAKSSLVKSVFLKKDGKTLIVTLPKTPAYRKYNEDIDLSPYNTYKDDIKLTVDLEKAFRVGFLEVLENEGKSMEDFVPLKSKKTEQLEREIKEELVESGEIQDVDAEPETMNIVIAIDKGEEIIPMYIDIDRNTSKAYNDYLVAIGQKKKIVLRETKDES